MTILGGFSKYRDIAGFFLQLQCFPRLTINENRYVGRLAMKITGEEWSVGVPLERMDYTHSLSRGLVIKPMWQTPIFLFRLLS